LPNPSSEAKHSGCSGRGNYLLCLRHAQQRDRVRTMGFAAPAHPEQKLPSVAVADIQAWEPIDDFRVQNCN